MIDALFSQPNYSAVKKLLDATALRQHAIARNLANLETPHYQRVDMEPSFTADLRRAVAAQDGAQIQALQPALVTDRAALPVGHDGNTVDLESELLKLNENAVAHAVETQLLSGQLARLRLAITGRPI